MRPARQQGETPVTQNLARILSGNVSFGQNNTDLAKNITGFHAQNITTPAMSGTAFTVTHNLGYIPNRFWVTYQNAAGNIYDSGTAWTTTTISLKCSADSVTISLFID